jgi:hypothetical protein
VNTRTLPVLEEWPYTAIAAALGEYRSVSGKVPKCIVVGMDLWMMLREVSSSDDFLVGGQIPIVVDRTGVLEGHEFILSGVDND